MSQLFEKLKHRSLVLVFLGALIFAQGFVLRSFVLKDTNPLAWDESIHMLNAFKYKDDMISHHWGNLFTPAYFHYPPLYHFTLSLALGKTSDVADVGALVNFFYLAMMIIFVYLITEVYCGTLPGLTASFLVSCYPIIFTMARPPMIDLPLSALISGAAYFWIKSENFKNKISSVLFGIFFGLALLTKWTAFIYLLGFLGISFLSKEPESRLSRFTPWVCIVALLILPWYLLNLIPSIQFVLHCSALSPAGGENYGHLNWLWYIFTMFGQLNLFFFLLFIPGLFVVFWKPKLFPIFLWFFVSIIFLTLLNNKNTRYSMPVLPAVAILSVAWIPSFRRWVFIALNLMIGFFFVSYHFHIWQPSSLSIRGVQIPIVQPDFPSEQDWKHKEIIQRIRDLKSPSSPYVRVTSLPNSAFLHSTTMNISLMNIGYKDFSFRGASKNRWTELSEFILIKTGELGPPVSGDHLQKKQAEVLSPSSKFNQIFTEVGRWTLPDKSDAILYQCNPKPLHSFDIGLFNMSLKQLSLPRIEVSNVQLKAIPLSSEKSAKGEFKELLLKADQVNYAGVVFHDVSLSFIHPQINLPLFLEKQEFQLLRLESLYPQATIPFQTIFDLVHNKVSWINDLQLKFDRHDLNVMLKAKGFPIDLVLNVEVQGEFLLIRIRKLSIAKIPFPLFLLRPLVDQKIQLTPNDEMPFSLKLQEISGDSSGLIFVSERRN